MKSYKEHLILSHSSIREALIQLDRLAIDAILFVINEENHLLGSLTDGDVRRGLINGVTITDEVDSIMKSSPRFIKKGEIDVERIIEYREGLFKILPVLDNAHRVINVINLNKTRSYLPVDAVIMAGGKGQRLRPLTDTVPKPLLKVSGKPILEHNLDRLSLYGIDNFWISVKYLGEQIEAYFGDGSDKNVHIEYVWEDEPMGTIGAVSKISNLTHDHVLISNSDILTNIDYEHFFLEYLAEDADLAIVTIPYEVNVPYAVLETSEGRITSFKEKPSYTYYSNGGIYLVKRELLEHIPNGVFYNATDLMEQFIAMGKKVCSYPLRGYWLDIGKHEDYDRAQEDINHISF